MNATDVQEQVRSYLISSYLPGELGEKLRNDDRLLEVLNSLQLLRMVIEIESMFGITIDNSELSVENLGTIANVAAFVQRKTSA
jgi:acyl carrier protein